MLILAAAKPTVWEKLQAVPGSTWASLALGVLAVVLMVRLWRSLRDFNEFAPWLVLVLIGGSVVLYWTYERKEPKVLSPIFDVLAKYLPSKIQYREAPTGGG